MEQYADDILEVRHVTNYYKAAGTHLFGGGKKKRVLNDVSLTIHNDEFFGLVGESGSGKSTLANCILGLIPYEGEIAVNGQPAPYDRRLVQAVFQDPMSALDPRKTIGFTLQEPLRAHRKYLAENGIIVTKEDRLKKVHEMLTLVGLDPSYADRYPDALSGGQRQRVCIAASLMLSPPLILADEAISALDVSVGSQILNLFMEIHDKADFGMLFISHNLNVVYYLCDRIAVLYNGQIVEQGDAEILYSRPRHPYTKQLLSAVPELGRTKASSPKYSGYAGSASNTAPASNDPGQTAHAAGSPAAAESACAPADAEAHAGISMASGCPFADRCPERKAACGGVIPFKNVSEPAEDGSGAMREHLVRCVLV